MAVIRLTDRTERSAARRARRMPIPVVTKARVFLTERTRRTEQRKARRMATKAKKKPAGGGSGRGSTPKPTPKPAEPKPERSPRAQAELDDLVAQAEAGMKITPTQWSKLVQSGYAERDGVNVRLSEDGRKRLQRKEATFTVIKQAGQPSRWIAISSTAYEDRDGEIVTKAALAADVARADADGDYGTLQWWHTPVRLGVCDFNAMVGDEGRILLEMGTFDDEAIADAVAKEADTLALSLGFLRLPHEPADGAYTVIRRKERSLLPKGRESNPFTTLIGVTKENDMDETKLQAALEKLGATPEGRAALERAIAAARGIEVTAKEQGITTKAAGDIPPDDTAVVAAEVEVEAVEEEPMSQAEFVGDMTPDEFRTFLKAALSEVIGDMSTKLMEIDGSLKGMGYERRTKEQQSSLDGIAKRLEAIEKTVKELNGDAPARTYRASHDAPVIDPTTAAVLKGDAPNTDPFASVAAWIANTQPR